MRSHSLFARDFTLMVVGQIVSLFGNSILRFALSLHVLETTGSAAAFGGISALAMVPALIFGPLGGVLADRAPRQRIMWGLDFFTAALVLGYIPLFPGGGPLWAVGAVMVLLSAIQAVYQPAVQASVPLLAPAERLAAANGTVSQVQALANLLGPILGGALYTWAGLEPLLAVGGACFFGSAVMELFLRIPFARRAGGGTPFATAARDLAEAGRFLTRERPALAALAALAALLNLFLSALLVVGLPYLVNVVLALSPLHYSFAEAALSLGSILGGALAGPALGRRGLGTGRGLLLGAALPLLPLDARTGPGTARLGGVRRRPRGGGGGLRLRRALHRGRHDLPAAGCAAPAAGQDRRLPHRFVHLRHAPGAGAVRPALRRAGVLGGLSSGRLAQPGGGPGRPARTQGAFRP